MVMSGLKGLKANQDLKARLVQWDLKVQQEIQVLKVKLDHKEFPA